EVPAILQHPVYRSMGLIDDQLVRPVGFGKQALNSGQRLVSCDNAVVGAEAQRRADISVEPDPDSLLLEILEGLSIQSDGIGSVDYKLGLFLDPLADLIRFARAGWGED